MSKEIFSVEDLHNYYLKYPPATPLRLSLFAFQALIKSGARKLIARDGSGIRCMILYLPIDGTNHIICECGNTKKLKGRMPEGECLLSSYSAAGGISATPHLSKLHIFFSDQQKEFWQKTPSVDFQQISWKQVSDQQFAGFCKFQAYDPFQKIIAEFAFLKCQFRNKSAALLVCFDQIQSLLTRDLLLQLFFQITFQELGSEVFVFNTDTLPDYERECDDWIPVYRSAVNEFFIL